MKKTQQMTVSRKFVDIMTEYNKIQMEHRDASKGQMKRQMELAGTNLSDDDLETMLEEGGRAQLLGHVQVLHTNGSHTFKQVINEKNEIKYWLQISR